MRRPGPLRWLWYAMGGGLPERYRDWVLHDVTTRTWALRQMLRSIVQLVPIGILLVLLVPGELWVRLVAVLGGAAVGDDLRGLVRPPDDRAPVGQGRLGAGPGRGGPGEAHGPPAGGGGAAVRGAVPLIPAAATVRGATRRPR
jgi:hypothetical protein